MLSQKNHLRSFAMVVTALFSFLLAVESLPLAARDELKKSHAVATVQVVDPDFMEQTGERSDIRRQKSRLLPSLLGLAVAGAVVAVLVLKVFKKTGYNPHIIPLDFVQGFSNPYFPLVARQTRNYAVTSGASSAQLTVKVSIHTKLIMGVLCLGVQDQVLAAPRFFEDTWRWYAQDLHGHVWYFARETKKYDFGVLTGEWSWQAGIDGAKPGMIMAGQPRDYLNKEYREEYAPGVEEDRAQVLSLNETVTVPYGTFSNCLKIKVHSDLDPGRSEYRYYATGIGLILSETVPAGGRRLELVGISNE